MPVYSQLIIPKAHSLPASAMQPQQQPQVLVLNTAPKQRARLKPKGWAANSLAVAGVFFACAMLFVFATCGGLYYWMKYEVRGSVKSIGESVVGTDAQRSEARRKAAVALAPYGIKSVATNANAIRTDDGAVISGAGLDARGKTHRFSVQFDINTFGNDERWEATSIVLDGKEMVSGIDDRPPLVIRPTQD
jgi:hypothetical protein